MTARSLSRRSFYPAAWIRRQVEQIAFTVDEPQRFEAALKKAGFAGTLTP